VAGPGFFQFLSNLFRVQASGEDITQFDRVVVYPVYLSNNNMRRSNKPRLITMTGVQIYLNIKYVNYFAVLIDIPFQIFDSMN
jgi:hypothetical protein